MSAFRLDLAAERLGQRFTSESIVDTSGVGRDLGDHVLDGSAARHLGLQVPEHRLGQLAALEGDPSEPYRKRPGQWRPKSILERVAPARLWRFTSNGVSFSRTSPRATPLEPAGARDAEAVVARFLREAAA